MEVYLWLSSLGLMLMRGLDETNDVSRFLSVLRHFAAVKSMDVVYDVVV